MARRAKPEEGEGTSAVRGNGYDPDAVKGFVDRVETLESEKQVLKDECAEQCKTIGVDIKEVKEEALAAGIPAKELNAALKVRKLRTQIDATREKLEQHQQNNFDNLILALGGLKDLPLGQAALKQAA